MNTIKKYLPYAAIIMAIYMLVPLIFLSGTMKAFSPVAYYFVFPATAIICSAVFCSKYGMDFFFSLIAPIVYLPSMLIYNGGFCITNIILLVAYLVAGIFGLFVGDIALGDKRRKKEENEKEEAEKMMLEANRRDETIKEQRTERLASDSSTDDFDEEPVNTIDKTDDDKDSEKSADDSDDFDYSSYTADIDKTPIKSTEDEIDDILGEFGSH